MGIGIDRLTMLLTNQQSIQDVLLFPQMKPESQKLKAESQKEEYLELGVPEEWIDPLKKMGFITIEKLKEVEKAGKLANDLNGYNKKNKLGLGGLISKLHIFVRNFSLELIIMKPHDFLFRV